MTCYPLLLALFLLITCMESINYIRFGTCTFRICSDRVDCCSLHEALSADPLNPFDLPTLVRNLQNQYNIDGPWYPSLTKLYSGLYHTVDDEEIRRRTEEDRHNLDLLTSQSHDSVVSNDYPNKDAMVFSLLTGSRVIIISPTETSFHRFDSFQELEAIGIELPETQTRYLYRHAPGTVGPSIDGNNNNSMI